jgi:hypothetical protein
MSDQHMFDHQIFDEAVSDWLDYGSDRTPRRAIDAVLLAVKTTPQERDFRIRRRFNLMPTSARLTAVAAVVAAFCFVALSYFGTPPYSGGAPSPGATPTVEPPLSGAVSPRRTPDIPVTQTPPTEAALPVRDGALAAGSYDYLDVGGDMFNVRFTVPAGWTWSAGSLTKGGAGAPGGAAIHFQGGPLDVYADPCQWTTSPITSVRGYVELAVALQKQAGRSATSFGTWRMGNRAGFGIELTVPNDIDFAACARGEFRSWGPDAKSRSHDGPGQRDLVLATGGFGGAEGEKPTDHMLVVDAATFPGTPPDVVAEMRTILESLYVGLWG